MGVHDFGYRRYDGERTGPWSRLMAIARSDVAQAFSSKPFLFFFLLSIGPAIGAFFFVYANFVVLQGQGMMMGFERARGTEFANVLGRTVEEVEFFFDFLKGGTTVLTIVFSTVVGAAIISRDRRAGALELYLTRGIEAWHYAAGKWLGVWFMLLCQVLFPFLVVWLFAVLVAPAELGYFGKTIGFVPRLIAGQGLVCGTLALWLVALSASTESTTFAQLRWVGAVFVLSAVAHLLRRVFENANLFDISPWHVARRVGQAIAGAPPWQGHELGPALVTWCLLTAGAVLWLRRHLRAVEVVG